MGACDHLPAPGQWEAISPLGHQPTGTFDDGLTGDVRPDPVNSGTVFVGVKGYGLYKSTDCGATWAKMNTGRNGDKVAGGTYISLQVDPVDPQVIYVNCLYGSGGIWKSTNGGVDWDQILDAATMTTLEGGFVSFVVIDPAHHDHLLVSPHDGCTGFATPGCIGESVDGGQTWKIISAPKSGEGSGPIMAGGATILFAAGGVLWLTEDGGATWSQVSASPASGSGSTLYRAPDGSYYTPSINGMLRSTDLKTWSVIPIGRSVGFTHGDGMLFAADQWSTTYQVASESDPAKWTVIPAPNELAGTSYGGLFLRYDEGHHILYSSNFAGGLYRRVTR